MPNQRDKDSGANVGAQRRVRWIIPGKTSGTMHHVTIEVLSEEWVRSSEG